MPRRDPYETAIMAQCQLGALLCSNDEHRPTGSVCRKPHACRDEGRCYFVAGMERYLERMPTSQPRVEVTSRIEWHAGYDGPRWAL